MSEILIVLKLRRRSGVLASAVAALGRCGLEFRSQRISDDDGPRLDLSAEGQLSDCAVVVDAYAEVRGVAEVLDVIVDGQTLMRQPVPEEPAPVSEELVGDQTEAVIEVDEPAVASVPQADREPLPEPEPVESSTVEPAVPVQASSVPEQTENSDKIRPELDNSPDSEAPETDQPESEEERRRRLRMVMRRRRRYY